MPRPMLDGVELEQVQKVEAEDEEVLGQHGVPALEGDFLQDLGRRVTRLTLTGVITGADSGDQLKTLREKFRSATPVPFVEDIAIATKVDKVLIEEFGVRELAGRPNRFEFEMTLREFLPPPRPEQEEPPPPPPPIPEPEVETGTLEVEVIVEGQTGFDFSKVTVTAVRLNADGKRPSQTLTNRTGNVWTEERMAIGDYSINAVVTDPPPMSGSTSATLRAGQITRVQIILRQGPIIATQFVTHFRFDNAFLEPCMREVVQQVTRHATAHADQKLLMVGNTDEVGSPSDLTASDPYNQSLSERRARSAFAYARSSVESAISNTEWNALRQGQAGLPTLGDKWGTRQYQYMLFALGFYPGVIDGDHGPLTSDAVRQFRDAKGLPPGTTVDDPVWQALIADYLAQDNTASPAQFLPNTDPAAGCDGGILKWLGVATQDPVRNIRAAHRPNRRVEFLFVNTDRLPCGQPQPDTFNLPAAGAVSPTWCLGPGDRRDRTCFVFKHIPTPPGTQPRPNQWVRQPAEPGTVTVRGRIVFEDGSPAANVRFILIAPDGEFMDGERSDGNGADHRTAADGTFSYPTQKGVGIYTMELQDPFIGRLTEAPHETARGTVICKRMEPNSEFNVTLLLEACRLLSTVHFEPDRSFIRPSAKRALRALADFIQRSPAARRLLLAGHTDLVEDPATNVQLSLRRTQAVFASLTGNPPDPANPGQSIWLTLNNDENWGPREIQFMLQDLGFYCHHLTNVLDAETRRAIRAAKNRFGLGNNDVVDNPFRERLFTEYIAHNGAAVPVGRFLTPINSIGCAANHPVDIRGGAPFAGASERNRRVDFLIFPRPPRTALTSSTDCSQYPRWSTRCDKRLLEFIGPKRAVAGVVINPADAEEELAFMEVSNWDNAFDFDPPDPVTGVIRPTGNAPRADFFDRDPDRFFIQITDLDRRGAGPIRARIKTIDRAGADLNPFVEHELIENPNEPGLFRSNSLLLVADEIDNGEIPQGAAGAGGAVAFQVRGIANGALNDPLLRAEIGGQVVVELNGAELGRLPVCDPDCLKVIPLSVVILRRTDGAAVTTEADVQERVNRLQQAYMQTCIRFDATIRTATAAEMPAGVILSALSGIDVNGFGGLPNRTALTAEELALFDSALNARSAAAPVPPGQRADIVQVFYANFLEAGALRATANSYMLAKFVAPTPEVVNCIIVGADDPEENSTLPHEMLHILLNQLHFPPGTDPDSDTRTNVFFRSALGELAFTDTTVVSNKRIPEAQVERVLNNGSGVIP